MPRWDHAQVAARRHRAAEMRRAGWTITEISDALGVHRTTVWEDLEHEGVPRVGRDQSLQGERWGGDVTGRLRRRLARARRAGLTFETAWGPAVEAALPPKEYVLDRADWKEALHWSSGEWEAAYNGSPARSDARAIARRARRTPAAPGDLDRPRRPGAALGAGGGGGVSLYGVTIRQHGNPPREGFATCSHGVCTWAFHEEADALRFAARLLDRQPGAQVQIRADHVFAPGGVCGAAKEKRSAARSCFAATDVRRAPRRRGRLGGVPP